jgi:cytochrome P450 family 4
LIEPWLKTGLLTSNGEKWLQRRKIITPAFHFDILKDYFSVMSEQSEIFAEKLMKLDRSAPICLLPHIAACTLDIICGNYI